eukprot:TRINITY_DN9812_c0_g1_i1.p1 TRINITY_DN9812_c0_g1~~TRINITY_DN9812_c0_g1_i1.p1  ORF type:complete len:294 (+),score=86.40 TRINITY_DN9812_c0_g1_i1:74-955(+)
MAIVLALGLAAAAVPKQGFSGFLGRSFTCEDAEAVGLSGSWSYTWTHMPSQYNKCRVNGTTAEFVPMVIGLGAAKTVTKGVQRQWAEHGVKYLLGYNEPDEGNGHNHPHMCAPAAAAADWPQLQALAAKFTPPLELVSPAMSTTGLDDTGKSQWLDEFFGNCTAVAGCDPSSVKYIAFHDYQGNVTELLGRVDGLYSRYNRPLWLTEFAINKWSSGFSPSRADQDAYMKAALPALDTHPGVFRYAWYTARDAPPPPSQGWSGGSLLEWNVTNPTLTSTGAVYKAHAEAGRAGL